MQPPTLPSWLEIPDALRDELDPILDAYEAAWRESGRQPIHDDFLASCDSEESREFLAREIKYTDAHFASLDTRERERSPTRKPRGPVSLPDDVGRFEPIKHIGTGGFGSVFLARDPLTRQSVAVKLPHPNLIMDKDVLVLKREATVLEQLDHPNIVKYLESDFETYGRWYMCTEWVDGASLSELLEDGPLSISEAVRITAQVADGLEYGHQRNIVHRDIKPSNIMLDQVGQAKILDYGLAKIMGDLTSHAHTETGVVKGTLRFMAPEQAGGKYDARSDVYSLGMVLLEMLIGKTSRRDALKQLHTINPPTVYRVCKKALNRSPEKRYQSAAEFKEDLQACLALIEPNTFAVIEAAKVRRRTRSRVLAAVPIVVLSLLIVMGAITASETKESLGPRPEPTVAAFFNEQNEALVWLTTKPSGADVYVYPLNQDGVPDKIMEVHAGQSPVDVWLPTGEYFVTVIWPDGSFHEVLRRVPPPDAGLAPVFYLCIDFELRIDGLYLPTIVAPALSTAGMVMHDGVWFDVQETAYSDFPARQQTGGRDYSFAGRRVCASRVVASDYLESLGLRLPFLHELTAAIDAGVVAELTELEEWTSTFEDYLSMSGGETRVRFARYQTLKDGQDGLEWDVNSISERLGFRGARSARPLPLNGD